jgi:hypothetical protein
MITFICNQNYHLLMSSHNGVVELLDDIKTELEQQLTVKNNNEISMENSYNCQI